MVLWQQLDSEVRKGLGTMSQVTAANQAVANTLPRLWPTGVGKGPACSSSSPESHH